MAKQWPMIDPGELRTPVLIQAQLPTSPPTFNEGGPVVTWQTILGGGPPHGYCFAKITPRVASDIIAGGQNVSEVEIPITTRYDPLIQANCRIVNYTGPQQLTYIIKAPVNIDERNVLVEWSCVALGATI